MEDRDDLLYNFPDVLRRWEEAQANPDKPPKSARELALEFPYIPGLRMMALREYDALQDKVEASKYTGGYGWNAPTGRPRESHVLGRMTV